MKLRNSILTATAILGVWLFGIVHICFAADTIAETNAPTGLYVSVSGLPEQFVIELKTNGLYTVQLTGLRTNSQSGVWSWDATKRQFLLTPGTNDGAFLYALRVLRIDPREADTLQWIPLGGIGHAGGAIDYVRFKRKDE